jgi:diphthamide synthase (EF-2-diphthine--ammonia ligase)
MTMRVAVLTSGGKDSCAAWWWAMCRGWDVSVLVTLVVEGDSPMFQVPNTRLVEAQASAAGVPWDHRVIDGTEGPDFEALQAMLQSYDLDGFVSGASHGFDVLVTSVSAEGLDDTWLGRVLDHATLNELEPLARKHRFNVDGEGGEYETLVVRAPMFPEGLDLRWSKVWDGRRGHLTVT